MIFKVEKILKVLKSNNIDFFTGVPDSVLKNFSNLISNFSKHKHIITANEGGAVSLATGYYLATKKIPLVYFQNSGLGNIINPITSMIHKKIYGIPMVLFIGWRGAPKIEDEIQHKVQGQITLKQLKLLNIKYKIFDKRNYTKQIKELVKYAKRNKQPSAYIFKINDLNSFSVKKIKKTDTSKLNLIDRSNFIKRLIKLSNNSKIVATTGFTSRELFQLRETSTTKNKDFYMVGAMGHASMVSLGVSLKSKKKVICLDGDGSFLMHMGSSVISSNYGVKNYKYVILNNECHESVGEQPTSINKINLKMFSMSIGYKNYFLIKNKGQINKILKKFISCDGPSFLEVKIKTGSLSKLKRIKNLLPIRENFMKE
tara:strand:+ start:1778 stop:2890 length:1113 start_codon:yes stop_codon:yes gene_type:complete